MQLRIQDHKFNPVIEVEMNAGDFMLFATGASIIIQPSVTAASWAEVRRRLGLKGAV